MNIPGIHRRAFLRGTAKATLATIATPLLCNTRLFGDTNAGTKLNIACIGLGGQMHGLMRRLVDLQENIIAICDVDANRIIETRKAFGPTLAKAEPYNDFRKLLEREKSLDAVVIATPDHWHARICTAAIQAGKHVYCEKPLTHTVAEARHLGTLASQSKVITQTGNQGSGSANFRRRSRFGWVETSTGTAWRWNPKANRTPRASCSRRIGKIGPGKRQGWRRCCAEPQWLRWRRRQRAS